MKTTKAEHTPGPWKFGGTSSWEIYSPDGEAVAVVKAAELWQDGICDLKHERSIAKANARLIAAAPELLEACKAICEAVSDCLPISGEGKVDALYYKAKLLAIDQAAAICSQAISKAEEN